MLFFPGRETTAREKSLPLRRKLFSLDPTVDMKLPGYSIVPEGLRSFARSQSPDRAKNIVPSVLSVSPWLIKTCIQLCYRKYAEGLVAKRGKFEEKPRIDSICHAVSQNCYGFEKLIFGIRNICLREAKSETAYLEGILVG
jgi:hypothetical protein